MPSEKRKEIALLTIRSQIEQFRSALAVTTNQVKSMLAGTGHTASDDQSEALGFFAKDKVNFERFASFTAKTSHIDAENEVPIRAALDVLKSLLEQGDDLFIIKTEQGKDLGIQLSARLGLIGRAFAAARVIDLAKNNTYKEDKHASLLERFPYDMWSDSERALSPALVIEVSGADFKPSLIIPLLDNNMKIVFNVTGAAPAAALSRLISPGVFVQQEIADASLDAFMAFKGIAVVAFLAPTAVSFVHDPSAGATTYERFTSLTFPKEVRKQAIGGISPAQQAEDYKLLESLSIRPELTTGTATDPAGKLSAWLLDKTKLSDLSV